MPKSPRITVRGLVAWLRKKPKNKTYDYLDNYNCLLCQYMKEQGFTDVHAGGFSLYADDHYVKFSTAVADIPDAQPWTFGGALERAEKALKRL